MELQSAELQATCAALGYADGDTYHKEPDCLESIKDLIVFLRRDEESCDRRRQLGEAQIFQTDLIPIVKHYKDDKILLETVIRLMVNLTQAAKLCFQNHVPDDKITLSYYLQVESHLQSYKEAFCDEALVAVLTKKLGDLLSLTWETRQEEDRLLIERILLLMRNILHIAPNPVREMRTDDDASVHDQVLWAMHVSGMEDLLLYLASSDDERQFVFHVLEIISLMFREQDLCSEVNPLLLCYESEISDQVEEAVCNMLINNWIIYESGIRMGSIICEDCTYLFMLLPSTQ